ncbi:hypothetical protein PIB30_019246 [Stylosanthes scabra]|uniref:Uncharacterized protein n=1 Tax=Stylosanthes scabra TaxID=79078 RepID=A0ABU6R8H3_9FABA|nr:hypothetical protein [Stylosanthes scabra]
MAPEIWGFDQIRPQNFRGINLAPDLSTCDSRCPSPVKRCRIGAKEVLVSETKKASVGDNHRHSKGGGSGVAIGIIGTLWFSCRG